MKLGLALDLVAMAALFAIPLPDAWRTGGAALLLLWIGVNLLSFGVLTRLACTVCPFEFCAIGTVGRAVWGRGHRGEG